MRPTKQGHNPKFGVVAVASEDIRWTRIGVLTMERTSCQPIAPQPPQNQVPLQELVLAVNQFKLSRRPSTGWWEQSTYPGEVDIAGEGHGEPFTYPG